MLFAAAALALASSTVLGGTSDDVAPGTGLVGFGGIGGGGGTSVPIDTAGGGAGMRGPVAATDTDVSGGAGGRTGEVPGVEGTGVDTGVEGPGV